MRMQVLSEGDATALGIETPDGGMTIIVQRGELHAEMYVTAWQRQQLRYAAGAEKARRTRKSRQTTTDFTTSPAGADAGEGR